MNITQAYAIAAGGIFLIFVLANCRPHMAQLIKHVSLFTSKHLTYPHLISRHRFLGLWTRADVLVQLVYVAANVFCLSFQAPTVSEAGLRAGTLSLVNMVPLFAGFHISFLADLLGVSIITYRLIHRSLGLMSFVLVLFHVLVAVTSGTSFSLATGQHLFALIVSTGGWPCRALLIATGGSISVLPCYISLPVFRKISFEIFLRTHQALGALFVYSAWRHLPSDGVFPRFYLYVAAAMFLTTLLLQAGSMLYRNGTFRYGRSRAFITHDHGTVKIGISLSKPLKVEPGQYINLWIPSVSFWSFLQSHPFMVTSWADGKQDTLELFVEPRTGLTRELLRHAETDGEGGAANSRLVLFSGPHGFSAAVGDYENVLMIAGEFGIAAHLPYLKRLIHGYNARKVRARRIHLVWQIRDIKIGIAAQSLFNRALDDDTLDSGYILQISIYVESDNVHKVSFGRRSTVYNGPANMREILQTELAGEHPEGGQKDVERLQDITAQGERGKTLVMVSGTDEQRNDVRGLVRGYLNDEVEMLELEYQPTQR